MRKHAVIVVVLFILASFIPAVLASGGLTWPVDGEIITQFSEGAHNGIDISASIGDTVIAAQGGEVHWIGKTPRGEPCISIDDPNSGLTTTYLPVQALVAKGQTIKAGDIIGRLSSEIDISSEVPHLHLGLFVTSTRDNKKYLNPADHLAPWEPPTGGNNEAAPIGESIPGPIPEVVPEIQPSAGLSERPRVETGDPAPQQAASAPITPEKATGDIAVTEGIAQSSSTLQAMITQNIPAFLSAGLEESPGKTPVGLTAINAGNTPGDLDALQVDGRNNGNPLALQASMTRIYTIVGSQPVGQFAYNGDAKDRHPGKGFAAETANDAVAASNPFVTSKDMRRPVAGVKDRARYLWVDRIMEWRFLPEAISAIVLLVISISCSAFMRRTRQFSENLFAGSGASC